MKRYLGWMVLILFAAACLRFYQLPTIPPGLTHDEADHGLSAWGVVNGIRPLYFTVGYGREPLYDYATAGLMTFLGPTYLAGRLTSVYFSLLLIAGMAAWTRLAFGRRVALLTAAGLALGFWPLMTARQGLRSITQPTLFVLALWSYWLMVNWAVSREPLAVGLKLPAASGQLPAASFTHHASRNKFRVPSFEFRVIGFVLPACFLGLSFYTYIPARIVWLLFPGLWLYLWVRERGLARRLLGQTLAMLAVAAAIGFPLFRYLQQNPSAELRIGQLSGPLTQALQGDFAPLLTNMGGALRLFTAVGDTAWRYNIAGKPWLDPVMGGLFYLGVMVAVGWVLRPRTHSSPSAAAFLALLWLVLGLAPSLITGPALSTTQAIALQPVLYLFPALALAQVGPMWRRYGLTGWRQWEGVVGLGLILLLWGRMGFVTGRDYFAVWGQHPEVRVQYETNLAETIRYVNQMDLTDVAISTTTPGQFHSPAVAQMMLTQPETRVSWFNGQGSLLIPLAADGVVTFSGFAPLPPALMPFFAAASPLSTLSLRPDDLDRPVTIYRVDGPQLSQQWATQFNPITAQFGANVRLLGYQLTPEQPQPGTTVQIVTWWEILAPADDLMLFTHLVGEDGPPLAQVDRLDVPASGWQAGDMFLQLHELMIPGDIAAATYPLNIGFYTPQPPFPRLLVTHADQPAGDTFILMLLTIAP